MAKIYKKKEKGIHNEGKSFVKKHYYILSLDTVKPQVEKRFFQ